MSCGQPTPPSGLRLIMEESRSWVPESPINLGKCSNKKALDAARIFSLQKTDGFSFKMVDQELVTNLAILEDLQVVKDGLKGRTIGDQ